MTDRSIVVISAGLSQPSSSRLLADRLAGATSAALVARGLDPRTETVELRDHARELVDHLLTGFPAPDLQAALERVLGADGLIAVSPVFNAAYSGLFKLFFDVLERDSLAGVPVVVGATGGTTRHSLVLDHGMRPMFAYLGALVLPTGVYAAAEDWGRTQGTDPALAARIERAGGELAAVVAGSRRTPIADRFAAPPEFADLLRGVGAPEADEGD